MRILAVMWNGRRWDRTYERDKVSLGSLLEGHDGRRLEAEVGLEVLGDFTDQALEGELADEELGRLLCCKSAFAYHTSESDVQ